MGVETLTERGAQQNHGAEVRARNHRGRTSELLLIDGEAVPFALARIPMQGETRGNLAAGGSGVGQPLSARDRFIAERVGPELRRRGLTFVGIDVIGDYLTEINVTCPTCVRELDAAFDLDIAGDLLDNIADRLGGTATSP